MSVRHEPDDPYALVFMTPGGRPLGWRSCRNHYSYARLLGRCTGTGWKVRREYCQGDGPDWFGGTWVTELEQEKYGRLSIDRSIPR